MLTTSSTLTPQQHKCADACFACAQICDNCSDDMIGMREHGDQKDHEIMAKCIRLCRECAEICLVTGMDRLLDGCRISTQMANAQEGGNHAYDIFHIDSPTTQMCRCVFCLRADLRQLFR
jgi:hypothetical protein